MAHLVGGELVGRGDVPIAGVASLDGAGSRDLSFLVSSRYLLYFQRTSAAAVLVPPEFRDAEAGPATRIVVPDPLTAAAHILGMLAPEPRPPWGIHPTVRLGRGVRWQGRIAAEQGSVLGDNVRVGEGCWVGPYATVEDGAVLGNACRIGPQTVVHRGTHLGDRVVLKAGARVGCPGFGFTGTAHGPRRIPHVGGCVIESDVEVGANTTIDRGMLDDTVVGAGTKIDNLVQIGHNVRIGARCVIMGQVGIGGSTTVEDDVLLAGQAGLAGHLTVARGARVAAQAGVIGDVPAGSTVSGYPARSHRTVLRQAAALARLTPLVGSLERLTRPEA